MSDYTVAGSMRVGQSDELPDLLDVLIAGGGPAGTVAAMRARELGLSALVIDYDDLMKRIRDYDPSKDILPSYGGWRQGRVPKWGTTRRGAPLRAHPQGRARRVVEGAVPKARRRGRHWNRAHGPRTRRG